MCGMTLRVSDDVCTLFDISLRRFLTTARIPGVTEEGKIISLITPFPIRYGSHCPRVTVLLDIPSSPVLLPHLPLPRPSSLWWPAQATMYPISDLTTFCRKTLGDVPPKLVVCIHLCHTSRYPFSPSFLGRIYHRRRFQDLSICRAQSRHQTNSDTSHLVQGGRLVAERRMVTDIYMFDIETFTWEKVPQGADSDQPRARYFHSTDACKLPEPYHTMCPSLTAFSHPRILVPQGTTI